MSNRATVFGHKTVEVRRYVPGAKPDTKKAYKEMLSGESGWTRVEIWRPLVGLFSRPKRPDEEDGAALILRKGISTAQGDWSDLLHRAQLAQVEEALRAAGPDGAASRDLIRAHVATKGRPDLPLPYVFMGNVMATRLGELVAVDRATKRRRQQGKRRTTIYTHPDHLEA